MLCSYTIPVNWLTVLVALLWMEFHCMTSKAFCIRCARMMCAVGSEQTVKIRVQQNTQRLHNCHSLLSNALLTRNERTQN